MRKQIAKKKKCRCGETFELIKEEVHTIYVKQKPNGKYVVEKVVYCPACGAKIN